MPVPPPSTSEVESLLVTVRTRILRLLVRRGLWTEAEVDAHDDVGIDAPDEAPLYAASVRQLALTGPRAGQPIRRLRSAAYAAAGSSPRRWTRHAPQDGFDLDAGLSIRAHARSKLERVCRYPLRPPLAADRLQQSAHGKLLLTLERPFRDGTSHVLFEPLELLERLAALIPRPQKNLVLYHGVLAPNARLRRPVVAYGRPATQADAASRGSAPLRRPNLTWAELMRRGLHIDVLECPHCGAPMRFVASILQTSAIRAILDHLGLPSEPIHPAPARAPPDPEDFQLEPA